MVHAEHERAWKNGKHQNQWIARLKTYAFPKMGDRLVSEIEGPLIRDVLARIWLSKPETAPRSATHRHGSRLVLYTRISCNRSADAFAVQGAASAAQEGQPFRGSALCLGTGFH